jgi:PhnB protein
MTRTAKPIPDGFHTATPYLIVKGATRAIEFYKQALGATELMRASAPDGTVRHAEIKVGDSPIMLSDETLEFPDWLSPTSRGGTPVHIYLYVEDADGLFSRALAAGAKQLSPMTNKPYGDRSGTITDPFGHVWYIATHIKDVEH